MSDLSLINKKYTDLRVGKTRVEIPCTYPDQKKESCDTRHLDHGRRCNWNVLETKCSLNKEFRKEIIGMLSLHALDPAHILPDTDFPIKSTLYDMLHLNDGVDMKAFDVFFDAVYKSEVLITFIYLFHFMEINQIDDVHLIEPELKKIITDISKDSTLRIKLHIVDRSIIDLKSLYDIRDAENSPMPINSEVIKKPTSSSWGGVGKKMLLAVGFLAIVVACAYLITDVSASSTGATEAVSGIATIGGYLTPAQYTYPEHAIQFHSTVVDSIRRTQNLSGDINYSVDPHLSLPQISTNMVNVAVSNHVKSSMYDLGPYVWKEYAANLKQILRNVQFPENEMHYAEEYAKILSPEYLDDLATSVVGSFKMKMGMGLLNKYFGSLDMENRLRCTTFTAINHGFVNIASDPIIMQGLALYKMDFSKIKYPMTRTTAKEALDLAKRRLETFFKIMLDKLEQGRGYSEEALKEIPITFETLSKIVNNPGVNNDAYPVEQAIYRFKHLSDGSNSNIIIMTLSNAIKLLEDTLDIAIHSNIDKSDISGMLHKLNGLINTYIEVKDRLSIPVNSTIYWLYRFVQVPMIQISAVSLTLFYISISTLNNYSVIRKANIIDPWYHILYQSLKRLVFNVDSQSGKLGPQTRSRIARKIGAKDDISIPNIVRVETYITPVLPSSLWTCLEVSMGMTRDVLHKIIKDTIIQTNDPDIFNNHFLLPVGEDGIDITKKKYLEKDMSICTKNDLYILTHAFKNKFTFTVINDSDLVVSRSISKIHAIPSENYEIALIYGSSIGASTQNHWDLIQYVLQNNGDSETYVVTSWPYRVLEDSININFKKSRIDMLKKECVIQAQKRLMNVYLIDLEAYTGYLLDYKSRLALMEQKIASGVATAQDKIDKQTIERRIQSTKDNIKKLEDNIKEAKALEHTDGKYPIASIRKRKAISDGLDIISESKKQQLISDKEKQAEAAKQKRIAMEVEKQKRIDQAEAIKKSELQLLANQAAMQKQQRDFLDKQAADADKAAAKLKLDKEGIYTRLRGSTTKG